MTPPPPPIACDLGALTPEQRAREAELLAGFLAMNLASRETPGGCEFTLDDDPAVLGRVGELVALERLCCPFLSFDLSAPAGRGPVTLRVHGGPGAREFVRDTFRKR